MLKGVLFAGLATVAGGVFGDCVLTDGWRFSRDAGATWTSVHVPHDWAIAGPFDATASDGSTGKLPWRGKGLYRRTLEVTAADAALLAAGGRAYLAFDGVMASPRVKVNGAEAGGWDYGYMSFTLDVTKFVRAGANEIEVSADTTNHDSRWYPGAGIYRRVVFAVRPREHVIPQSLAITTPRVTREAADVRVSYRTPSGPTNYLFTVKNPRLWGVTDPYLYSIDICGETFRYGIRTAKFTTDDGFHLNGRRVQLRGVNLHSDLGLLGMAFDRSAARRQLVRMKEMGVNAIRTCHNPPAPELLDLCDEMGLLVWDECFDKWDATSGRTPENGTLEDYVVRNLRQFVRRDRNHPCVVVWSVSNEIWEWNPIHPNRSPNRWSDHGPDGQTKVRNDLFAAAVRSEDTTRAVGCGNRPYMNKPEILDLNLWDSMDVIGWNYYRSYAPAHESFPAKALVYSESASAVSSQGFFDRIHVRDKCAFYRRYESKGPWQIDGRDLESTLGTVDEEFDRMETDRYVAGEFIWTGADYLGEPSPFVGAARSSYFGAVDLTGVPKDRWYLYRSHWNPTAPTLWITPHWTWEKGDKVDVFVYTECPEAELILNGSSLGRRTKLSSTLNSQPSTLNPLTNDCYRAAAKYRLMWFDVPYEPGELKAVAYRDGKKVREAIRRTAGQAVRLVATPEISATNEPGALIWVAIEAVDTAGTLAPCADDAFAVTLEGTGEIVGTGNADATAMSSFADPKAHRLFCGRAMTVIRRTGPVPIIVRVTSPTLAPATRTVLPPDDTREENL